MTDLPLKNRLATSAWPRVTLQSRLVQWLLPLAVFLLAFLPRALSLDVFLTADEDDQLWFSAQFLEAVLRRDWAGALVLGYPGVPTMGLGALGLWLRYQAHVWGWAPLAHAGPDLGATLATVREYPLDYIEAARLPLAFTGALMLALIFLLLRRLLDRRLALLATLVVAFDPFLLAHSRIIHVDAPLAYFMFGAFLAFVLYLDRGGWGWLILSGVLGALAVLSKTPGAILGPILVVGGLCYALLHAPSAGARRGLHLRRLGLALVIWGIIAALAFFALWPSMWARPTFAVTWIINNVRSVNSTSHPTSGVFWGPTGSDRNPLYYLFVLPFHLTPVTTVGLLAGLAGIVAAVRDRRRGLESFVARHLPLMLALLSYAVLFVAPVSYVSRRGDRYILPIYLALDLLAVLGLWWLLELVKGARLSFKAGSPPPQRGGEAPANLPDQAQKLEGRANGGFAWLLGTVIIQTVFILLYQPYYFSYFNPLVGGYRTAPYLINVGWGEGLDQAARYLDQQAGSASQRVAAWYSWQFAPFYHGTTVDLSDLEPALTADHTVFYINQVQRGFPSPELLAYFADRAPEKVITLSGVDYAWIYPGPIISTEPPAALTHPADATFGGALHLYGLTLPDAERAGALPADGELPVTLFWEALAPTPDKLNVAVRLVDEQGVVWGATNRFPIGGLWYTHQWRPGVFVRDEYRLRPQPGTPPGTYALEVELYDKSTLETFGLARNLAAVTVVEPQGQVAPEELAAAGVKTVGAPVGNGLTLVGHTLEDGRLLPGQRQFVKLFWRSARPLAAEGAYQVQVAARPPGPGGEPWVLQQSPLPAAPPGQIRGTAYELSFPLEAPPGPYEIEAALLDPQTGQPLETPVTLGAWQLQDRPRNFALDLPATATPVSVLLNGEIELVGFELAQDRVEAGGGFGLTLYWRADRPLSNYTVFVHAVGPDGVLRGQWDSIPGGGALPTTGWLPGEVVADPYLVPMSDAAPAWKYDVYVGMYDSATGRRLPAQSQTLPVSDNRIFVGQVQVEP